MELLTPELTDITCVMAFFDIILYMKIIKRICPKISSHFFLFGPRGTGKSIWLKQNYQSALYLDLLNDGLYRSLVARPELMLEIVGGEQKKQTVIVDEAQKHRPCFQLPIN